MHPRVEIISDIAGIKVGEPITEQQLELLVQTILHDMLHYVYHVNSGKYHDIKSATARIETIVREGYGLK